MCCTLSVSLFHNLSHSIQISLQDSASLSISQTAMRISLFNVCVISDPQIGFISSKLVTQWCSFDVIKSARKE